MSAEESEHITGVYRGLTVLLVGMLLASCMEHGQGGPLKKLDPAAYVNYVPYATDFYRELMTGRVHVHRGLGRVRDIYTAEILAADGSLLKCSLRSASKTASKINRLPTRAAR